MSTLLVIGASSTVARAVLPQLAATHKVITAGRRDCDVYCDVTKNVSIPKGVDAIINFAAAFKDETDEDFERAVQTNVLGTLRICEAAHTAGIKHVVHISSIFALLKKGEPNFKLYSLTKRQGDELAEFYAEKNDLPLTILRPSRIYGDTNEFAKGQPIIYQLIGQAANGEDIVLYGKNDSRRNYIHVADLAEIIERVIDSTVTGTYACIQSENISFTKIAHSAQEIFGKGGSITFDKEKPDVPDDKLFDDMSLYPKINFAPVIGMAEGIRRIKEKREGER